ncbi:MAG: protein kinase [Polyangiaceae bacterium]
MPGSDQDQLAQAEARLGTRLRDKWRLDRVLGIGGMATVYEATHRNGKQAAIKVLRPEAALVSDIKARFLREGYLANRVGHPGAVSILDDDVDENGTVYLVMELLVGETLEQRWRDRGKLPWRDVVLVATQALDVLVHAHEKEIVHRDLKPGNIFLDVQSGVKILDFGIARLLGGELRSSTTGYETALGTPGFMPPEQARGRWDQVDATSDLYALGATMFSVIANRYLHEAETANEQLALAMTTPAPLLGSVEPDVPPEIASVVDRSLSFEKGARFPDARAMQAALRSAYQACTGESLEALPRLSVTRRARSVLPEAPTVGADPSAPSLSSFAPPERSTTSPTTETHAGRSPSRKAGLAIVAAVAVGLVALVGLNARTPAAGGSVTNSAAPHGPGSGAATTAAPEVRPAPVVTEPPGMPSANGAAPSAPAASETPKAIRSPHDGPRGPAKPPAAKGEAPGSPPASPDIFQSRK